MPNTIVTNVRGHEVHFRIITSVSVCVTVFEKTDPTSIFKEPILLESKTFHIQEQESREDFLKRVVAEAESFASKTVVEAQEIKRTKDLLTQMLKA